MDIGQPDLQADEKSIRQPEPGVAKVRRRSRRACADKDVVRALEHLVASGQASGNRSLKISARVDPGVFAAAAQRFNLPEDQVSEVINAALAIVAKRDTFKEWWRAKRDPLPDDFELAI